MKIRYIAGLLLLTACNIDQTEITTPPDFNFSKVIEYSPAPGQFINDKQLAGFSGETTPKAACTYAERRLRKSDFVSLGGWGGYIVVGFDTPVINDGGYNLAIQGNSISTSSEPGIVWVMQDENANGVDDDTWYELKGSEFTKSVRNYEVTYIRPEADDDPVAWSDNQGLSDTIDRTIEHSQAYFPAWVEEGRVTFKGSLLPKNVALINNLWIAQAVEWGYVDNHSKENRDLFRISDAVDQNGESITLPHINFVKIQTGVMDKGLLVGEISTEVCGVYNYNLLK